MNKLEEQIFKAKGNGLTNQEIGEKFNVNLRFIEKVITGRLGINVSNPVKKKKIKALQPKKFTLEKTTVWSFKSRGSWATHNGNYRGNWSPYIPRNAIIRYSKQGDLILDYFCGSGTTAVECKLLGRNFIGVDINPKAIELSKMNVNFDDSDLFNNKKKSDIKFLVGDARNLSFIQDNSVDLICSHPPYANIIHYTDDNPDDLSNYSVNEFLDEIEKVADESYRVLKNGHYCCILIGDMRKNKNVIPLGFRTIRRFLKSGFRLKELVIKRQHNCKTSGFWYKNSVKYNFLLLAHEYFAVFEKSDSPHKQQELIEPKRTEIYYFNPIEIDKIESTTVWIFDAENWYNKVIQNLLKRYNNDNYYIIDKSEGFEEIPSSSLIVVNLSEKIIFEKLSDEYDKIINSFQGNGYLALICNDIRLDGLIYPVAVELEKYFRDKKELALKEIVIISIEDDGVISEYEKDLYISHKYLLIYQVIGKVK